MSSSRSRLLVTGGAGYIGSHAVVSFLEAGWDVVVLDDLSNGHQLAVEQAGALGDRPVRLVRGNVLDRDLLRRVLTEEQPDAVAHFAALKSAPASVDHPAAYWRANVGGLATVLEAMSETGVTRLVHSSSAAVYGRPETLPIAEDAPLRPINPYGTTKLRCEEMIAEVSAATGLRAIALRYFNPVGGHPSAELGEDPRRPENLVPIAMEVAQGLRPHLVIHGTDYDTPDGTCIRDYVHVMDLAEVHAAAVEHTGRQEPGLEVCNVGTGKGASVREVFEAVREVTGLPLVAKDGPRRPGDPAAAVADVERAAALLGWRSRHTLREMVESAWAWRRRHPEGFRRTRTGSSAP